MFRHLKSQRRNALTIPETLGVVACLFVGLITGFWLFGEDLNKLVELATGNSQHSNAPQTVGAPSTREVFEGELDSHLDQHTPEDEIPTVAYQEETAPIDKAAVEALLKEEVLPAEQRTKRTGKPHQTFKIPVSEQTASPAKDSATTSNTSEASQSAGQRTLAFWNAMNTIMAQEEAMRTAPAAGINQNNAGDFINRRGEAGNYAAQAFRTLDTTGVDPDVVQLSKDIAHWYADGAKLNGTASYLLNRATAGTRRGQMGKNWADSEKAHNARVQEINRRGDQLRRQLSQKYGLAFPDLR